MTSSSSHSRLPLLSSSSDHHKSTTSRINSRKRTASSSQNHHHNSRNKSKNSNFPQDNLLKYSLLQSLKLNASPYKLPIQLPIQIFSTNAILCSVYIYGLLNYSLTTIVIIETHNQDWKMLYFALFWLGKAIGGSGFLIFRALGWLWKLGKIICWDRKLHRTINSMDSASVVTASGDVNENSFLVVRRQDGRKRASSSSGASAHYSATADDSGTSNSSPLSNSSNSNSWNPLKNVNMQRALTISFFLFVSVCSNIAFISLRHLFHDVEAEYSRDEELTTHHNTTWWIMIICRCALGLSHGVIITLVREHFANMGGEIHSGVDRGGKISSSGINYSQWRLGFLTVLSVMEFLAFSVTPALGLLQEYLGKLLFPQHFCPAQKITTNECAYPSFSTFTIMSVLLVILGVALMMSTCFLKTIYHKSTSIKKIMDPKCYRFGFLKVRKHQITRAIIVLSWIFVTFALAYCCIIFNSLDIFLPYDLSQLEGLGISLLLGIPLCTVLGCCVVLGVISLIVHLVRRRRHSASLQSVPYSDRSASSSTDPKLAPSSSGKYLLSLAGQTLEDRTYGDDNIARSKVILKYKTYAMFFMCLLLATYGFATASLFVNEAGIKMIIQCIFAVMSSAILPLTLALVWHSFYSTLENLFMRPTRFFMPFYTVIESLFILLTVAIIVQHSSSSLSTIFIFGFIIMVFGLFCMASITVLSVRNVVGVIVIHHGNREVAYNDNAILAVKQVRIQKRLFYLAQRAEKFLLSLDYQNRLVVTLSNRSQVEQASYFHRCFQHKNLLRLKGHFVNTQREEYHLLFEGFNTQKYQVMTLAQFYDESTRSVHTHHHFQWNQKIDIAIQVVQLISELHSLFCCHGHLSSWNVLLFISRRHQVSLRGGSNSLTKSNPIRKVKVMYLGQTPETEMLHASPWRRKEISSITDINDIGLLLLELFEGKLIAESSFRSLLIDDRDCDVPYSSLSQSAVDVAEFSQSYRQSRWSIIQSLMKECFASVPKISCRTIIQRLKKARLESSMEAGMLLEEEDEEILT